MSDSFPVDKSTLHQRQLEFVARSKRIPHSKVAKSILGVVVPQSLVGNTKGGHGNFCGQTSVEHHKGSKKRGEGLVRILSKS